MHKKKGMIVSGYFNLLHKGHIEYFNNAKALADKLFVIVNSDHQRVLKGSKEFQQDRLLPDQIYYSFINFIDLSFIKST